MNDSRNARGKMRNIKSWIGPCIISVLLAGCGKSGPPMGTVSGLVTVDGEPAATGSIGFFPTDGKSRTAGGVITDGKYTATVPVGTSKVEIRVSKKIGERKLYNTPDSPIKPVLAEVLPPKYNDQTELTIDVQSGRNEKNFELTSK